MVLLFPIGARGGKSEAENGAAVVVVFKREEEVAWEKEGSLCFFYSILYIYNLLSTEQS